ncbi:MAG TPA: phosphate signaling complex protein PhoU [Thermoanaerobaculia bacterium]|nr:phosphate signaling complex protein PhoU [Thermoanaerobaculia bacterium]
MERLLDQELDRTRQDLLRMGGLVEQMIGDAMRALIDRDTDLARGVVMADEGIDRLEKQLDEECHSILARLQPTAVDLRLLVSAMKINKDLERMGDSAVNIAQGVEILNGEPPLKPYIDLPRMAGQVRQMVARSLDAFAHKDAALAREVCESDDEIDALYHQLFRELLTYMIEGPGNVSRALQLLLIARNLERIADHATNVAEDVIYYVLGQDIRHSPRTEKAKR